GGVGRAAAHGPAPAAGGPAGRRVAGAGRWLPLRTVTGVAGLRRLERGKAVLEDGHLVFRGRDLGADARRRGAQRALVVGGLEGPVLAVAGDDHPLAGQPVPAGL